MLVIAACLLAVLSPLLAGRWPEQLALHRWRWAPLLWSTLALQVLAIQAPLPRSAAAVLHVATYVVAVAFLVANRTLNGILVVAAGALTNGVTIALNGGVLPASRAAAEAAGATSEAAFANSGVLERPVALWLGDVFAWPEPLPLANTFSVGDVLIVLGAAAAAWSGAEPLRRRRPGGSLDGAGVPATGASLEEPEGGEPRGDQRHGSLMRTGTEQERRPEHGEGGDRSTG